MPAVPGEIAAYPVVNTSAMDSIGRCCASRACLSIDTAARALTPCAAPPSSVNVVLSVLALIGVPSSVGSKSKVGITTSPILESSCYKYRSVGHHPGD